MLEEGGVARSVGQQDDAGLVAADARMGRLFEGAAQEGGGLVRVEKRRRPRELGKDALQDPPVLDRVGHARRDADVVFEHEPSAVAVADDVEAADVSPAAPGGRQRRPVPGGALHDPLGHDAVVHDGPFAVDVLKERVERASPLRRPPLNAAPLFARQDARHEVDRKGGRAIAPGGAKDDAGRHLLALEGRLAIPEHGRAHRAERLEHGDVRSSGSAIRLDGLVEAGRRVAAQERRRNRG